MADDRTYIRVHDGMDEHPKIEGLSDAAFRALFRCWFTSSRQRTDGQLTEKAWRNRTRTPKVRRELHEAGLAHMPGDDECPHPQCAPAEPGHVQMHDYLDHQRSAEEIEEIKAGRGAGGALGNHIRWHLKRRVQDPKCPHCYPPADGDGASQDRSVDRSDSRSQNDRSPIANPSHSQRQRQRSVGYVSEGGYVPNASDPPPLYPDHCSRHASVAEPGPCGHCADVRKARAIAPRLSLVSPANPAAVPHCGQCDETRHIETPDGVVRCPTCHPQPNSSEAS